MSKAAYDRLRKEFARLQKAPPPHVEACPLDSDILTWHYVIEGPPGSVYEGGLYHGKLVFPPSYPFKPPAIQMTTPSGRFQTDTRLCLSMSDFHPETWNPLWSVSSILSGLLSFMLESTPTLGSVESSDATKREHAVRSRAFNARNPTFRKLFPHHLSADVTEAEPVAETSGRQRRTAATAEPAAAASAAPVAAAAAPAAPGADGAAAAAADQPGSRQTISLLGGRITVREDQLYDYGVLLLCACTVLFAAAYVALK